MNGMEKDFDYFQMDNMSVMELESVFNPSAWIESDVFCDCDDCNDDN